MPNLLPAVCIAWALALATSWSAPSLRAQSDIQVLPGRTQNVGAESDLYSRVFPSRVKTWVKSSYDPDDRPTAASQGNDDGFSGVNACELYRTTDQGNNLAVIAQVEGRAGVMGLFFRNFWSGYAGLPMYPGEFNRARFWIDGALAHDVVLDECFRNPGGAAPQVPPFTGPFTGNRSGGHFTHAQLRWNDTFRLGLWDDSFNNASRFHRVAATLASPEGELVVPDMANWERILRAPRSWPHEAARVPSKARLSLPANGGSAVIQIAGPATLLELSCIVGSHDDWAGLRARFTWDSLPVPSVDVPLRLLGALVAPPLRFPVATMLMGNDGDRKIQNWYPMHFAQGATLEFVNDNAWPVSMAVTYCLKSGAHPAPWGHFTAFHRAETTQTGVPFEGPEYRNCRGVLRFLGLEDVMDTTGRIPSQTTTHLEGDVCVRVNGNRGDDHTFDASETAIGRWGWYLSPSDLPFVGDTSFQTGPLPLALPQAGQMSVTRMMGSAFVFDPIAFVDGIRVVLEHGVQNQANADYRLFAFLYVEPGAARITGAEIDIGDPIAEAPHQVQYTQWVGYVRRGGFLRDQFFGTADVTDTVRHVRDYLRFRYARSAEGSLTRPIGVGFRLDRLMSGSAQVVRADVLVDGQYAGLLHCPDHSSIYPWKEGGELEVELPRRLTDGKAGFSVELRPRPGSDPVRLARAWVYEYLK